MDPSPVICQIADAVVAELNTGGFNQAFTAQRAYAPVFDLGEMKDLHVTVVTRAASVERLDRTLRQFDYSIDVAVQKKLSTGGNAEIDTLMFLAEQIADRFQGKRLSQFNAASCLRVENDPIYSPDHLRDLRQFTSVLTLVFRG